MSNTKFTFSSCIIGNEFRQSYYILENFLYMVENINVAWITLEVEPSLCRTCTFDGSPLKNCTEAINQFIIHVAWIE